MTPIQRPCSIRAWMAERAALGLLPLVCNPRRDGVEVAGLCPTRHAPASRGAPESAANRRLPRAHLAIAAAASPGATRRGRSTRAARSHEQSCEDQADKRFQSRSHSPSDALSSQAAQRCARWVGWTTSYAGQAAASTNESAMRLKSTPGSGRGLARLRACP